MEQLTIKALLYMLGSVITLYFLCGTTIMLFESSVNKTDANFKRIYNWGRIALGFVLQDMKQKSKKK
jgi:hypothetical protein